MNQGTKVIWPCALAVALALPVTAQGYNFIKVADTTGPFFGFPSGGLMSVGAPSLNNSGTASFWATLDTGGTGIFAGSGGPITTIADDSGPLSGSFNIVTSINDGGAVAFHAGLDAGGRGIFAGDGGPTTTIADNSGVFSSFEGVAINDGGMVAFWTAQTAGGQAVYAGSGGPTMVIADDSGPFVSSFDLFPSINSSGTVAFRSALDVGGFGIYTSSGGPATNIVDDSDGFTLFASHSINDSGTVAFRAVPSAGGDGIFTGSGGALTTIVDSSGPFAGFGNFPSINNVGAVAFLGFLDSGGIGIYVGPDPIADKVIEVGDALFGSTVTALGFNEGLNDSGNVAFLYALANGVTGVAVTGIPEPTGLSLLALGSAVVLATMRRRGVRVS